MQSTYIVPFSMLLGHLGQLEADQFVATLFETRDDVGDESALDTCGTDCVTWFKMHGNVSIRKKRLGTKADIVDIKRD